MADSNLKMEICIKGTLKMVFIMAMENIKHKQVYTTENS